MRLRPVILVVVLGAITAKHGCGNVVLSLVDLHGHAHDLLVCCLPDGGLPFVKCIQLIFCWVLGQKVILELFRGSELVVVRRQRARNGGVMNKSVVAQVIHKQMHQVLLVRLSRHARDNV